MPMKNPPRPGKVVRMSCLEPFGLNVTEGAKVLGVSRQALANLVNCRARMSTDMTVRLAKAFDSTTETWIRLQLLTMLRKRKRVKIKSRSNATSRDQRRDSRDREERIRLPPSDMGGSRWNGRET